MREKQNWGTDTRVFPKWVIRVTLKMVKGCISTAEETDQHLESAGYYSYRKIMAPVDEEKFLPLMEMDAFKQSLKIPDAVPVISFVGRLNYFKDPLTFIRSCSELKIRGMEFVALIAGDGDLYGDCASEIDKLKLSDYVYLLGMRPDPEKIFHVSAVTVHVSPIENTWANSIAEAMFCGCPVIMTNVGFTRFTFTDTLNCLLVEPENPIALADAIIRLINDRDLSKRIVFAAKQLLIDKKKDKNSIVRLTNEYYKELIGQG